MRISSAFTLFRPLLWALSLLLVLGGCKDKDTSKEQLEKLIAEQKIKDDAAIQKYLTDRGIAAGGYERRDSGLYIIWQTRGTQGDMPKDGAQVKTIYIGRRLADDLRFDASVDNGTLCGCATFNVGQVIEGWNEVLKLMRKGDKVTILVPSHLAYGPSGNGTSIGSFMPLKFEIELLDFTNI